MKKKNDLIYYWCPLLKMNYYICYGWSQKKITKYMSNNWNCHTDHSKANGKCFEVFRDDSVGMVIWTETKDTAHLAHECVHATIFTMERRGFDPSDSHGELLAYNVQMLMELTHE